MSTWTGLLVSLALLSALADRADAQSPPAADAIKTIGTCVVIQTNETMVETPYGLHAEGACVAPQANTPSCTAEIVPTGPDVILDVTDNDGIAQCLKLSGDDPCTLVQNGPLNFQSQRHATQSFTAGAGTDQVRMTAKVRQKGVQRTAVDLPPGARFPLNAGRLFDVLKNRSAIAARLECTMTDGDQRIFPIVGDADLSPNIRFVAKNSAEPTFDILTYRVAP